MLLQDKLVKVIEGLDKNPNGQIIVKPTDMKARVLFDNVEVDRLRAVLYQHFRKNYSTLAWLDENGKLHREDGPAVIWIAEEYGDQWFSHGLLHRVGGPAVDNNYETEWYYQGAYHRTDGPARIYHLGNLEEWFVNGVHHNLDGPAIRHYFENDSNYHDDFDSYYVDGIELTREQFYCLREWINDPENANLPYSWGLALILS